MQSSRRSVADPIIAFVVAIVLGIAYGICVVAGLVIVQAIAEPKDLAGITGVYYSLAYSGFLLPTVLAALLPLMPYSISLGAVALDLSAQPRLRCRWHRKSSCLIPAERPVAGSLVV